MFIQSEHTPNPRTRRFLPGTMLHDGDAFDAPDAATAEQAPLAAALFALGGVEGVMIGKDWVSVSLAEGENWDATGPQVALAIAGHLTAGRPVLGHVTPPQAPQAWTARTPEEGALLQRIDDLLATRVRPAVAQDGGDVILHGITEDGGVQLALRGACAGCPSSTLTLKMGIENLLRHYFPGEVGWVEAVA